MNESEFEAFESRLRALRPADASPELRRAIAGQLNAAPVSSRAASGKWIRVSLFFSWAVTGATAALAVALLLREPIRSTDAAPADSDRTPRAEETRLVPVSGEGLLYAAHDEGLVFLGDGVPARRVRYQFLDSIEMRTPSGETRLNLSYPREEIRVVPIHTF
ncbi:hypothetical protein ASA1KI_11810 [Opitutales bacterium ASA1]|uniref:hypothetical protein n=1 Tax=Congregicoccus parvus TaxID=3081749 RepID=UPI002B2895D2|nr:hypothetical protein ASA1KI_11810 [Opitutales bacterium ASA1]